MRRDFFVYNPKRERRKSTRIRVNATFMRIIYLHAITEQNQSEDFKIICKSVSRRQNFQHFRFILYVIDGEKK